MTDGTAAVVVAIAVLAALAVGLGAVLMDRRRSTHPVSDRSVSHRIELIPSAADQAPVDGSESVRRFRAVFEASPVGIALADEFHLFVEVNPAWCRLLGRPADSLIGRSSTEFTHPENSGHCDLGRRSASESIDDGGVLRMERQWLRPDGEIRWGWLSIAPVPGPHGQSWTLVHAQDFTERKKVESVLQQSQDTLTALARVARCVQSEEDPGPVLAVEVRWLAQAASVSILEPAPGGTVMVTHCLGHQLAGAQVRLDGGAAGRIWGSGRPEFFDRAGADQWGFAALGAPPGTAAGWWQPLTDNRKITGVIAVTWDRRLTGPDDPSICAVRALVEEAGSVLTAARIRMELAALADTDALTGLVNRRGWQTHLARLTSGPSASARPLTLALLDLDHFKMFNDANGHHRGDMLLHDFATRARGLLRMSDVIARWGGEEFAIALPGCGAGDAGRLLNRIRAAVPDGQTCSIGHATRAPGESAAECMIRADAMLYRAKGAGRDCVLGDPETA